MHHLSFRRIWQRTRWESKMVTRKLHGDLCDVFSGDKWCLWKATNSEMISPGFPLIHSLWHECCAQDCIFFFINTTTQCAFAFLYWVLPLVQACWDLFVPGLLWLASPSCLMFIHCSTFLCCSTGLTSTQPVETVGHRPWVLLAQWEVVCFLTIIFLDLDLFLKRPEVTYVCWLIWDLYFHCWKRLNAFLKQMGSVVLANITQMDRGSAFLKTMFCYNFSMVVSI